MNNPLAPQQRGTTAEVQDRIDLIKDLLCQKYKRSQIMKEIDDKHSDWNVGVGARDNYIRKAKEQLLDLGRETHDTQKSEAIVDLRYLYKKALDDDRYNDALAARKELNRLCCLSGPARPAKTPIETEEKEERDVTPAVGEHLDTIFNRPVDIDESTIPEPGPERIKPRDEAEKEEKGATFASLGL